MTGDRERCLESGMDGYVSKPVNPEALYQEIKLVLSRAAKLSILKQSTQLSEHAQHSAPASPAPNIEKVAAKPVFDRADALSRIDGDEDLLATLLEMFIADAPNYLSEIDDALAKLDWPHLIRAAHTIKGVFATFSAHRGEHLAQTLEHSARSEEIETCTRLALNMHAEVQAFLVAIQPDKQL